MECRTFRNKISSLIDGELSDDDTQAAHEHLRNCRTCALEYRDLATAWELVARIPRKEPSAALWPVVADHLRREPAIGFPQLRRWAFPVLATAVFAGGIAIGILLGDWMQVGGSAPHAGPPATPAPVQNFQSVRHFADAPPGSLAEGVLVSSSSSEKRGNER